MIRRLGEGELPEADLCIIGSGAAGLALAREFLGTSWRVVVLESGGVEPDDHGEDLNRLECVGLPHDGGTQGRVRALGGTSRAWGGQLVPLRASEMNARPWVPHSGWPIGLNVLQPYYRRAEELFRVEGPPYDGAAWTRLGIAEPELDAESVCVRFSQWAPLARRNFAVLMRRQLADSPNITVVLDATVTALHAGERVESAEARSRHDAAVQVRAKRFVVCCGGIDSARLLLASDVGNSSGLVGRYFQDHLSYVAAEIRPRSRREVQRLFDPRYVGRTMYSPKLEPTDRLQREEGLLNAIGHLAFRIPEALGLLEIRRILRSMQAGRLELPSWDECRAMLRGSAEIARLAAARAFQSRRASPSSGAIFLLVDVEQAPNPDSRVSLSDSVDSLGMRRVRLDWRVTEQETRTLTSFSSRLAREFERLGLGDVKLAGLPDFTRREGLGATRDVFHHMGTTRMSLSPEHGVTDTNLRSHDLDNLFIASASVFPAGGIANPTFTLVALAIRLADHLRALK